MLLAATGFSCWMKKQEILSQSGTLMTSLTHAWVLATIFCACQRAQNQSSAVWCRLKCTNMSSIIVAPCL